MSRSVLSVILVVFIALGLQACGVGGKSAQEHLADAKAHQQQGDFNAAIIELKNALKQSPDNAEARWLLGSIYLESGDNQGAEKELQRSIDQGMDPATVAVALARAQLFQQNYDAVLGSDIDISSLSTADQVLLTVLRGDARLGLGELQLADELYDAALALDAESPEAMLGKARVSANQARLDKAREWVGKILQAREDFRPAWSFLGDLEQFQGNMTEAEEAYSRALELFPGSRNDHANRALVRIAREDLKGAAKDVGAAVRDNKQQQMKSPLVFFAQGKLKLAQADYVKAAEAFEETLEYSPGYLPARYFLAVSHYRMGSLEQAEQNLALFRNVAPQYAAGHRLYAAIKYSQGDYEVAAQELENLLSFDPDDSWSLALLADIRVMQNDPEQSIESYRRLVELHPDSESTHLKLALGLMMVDEEAARRVLNEAAARGNSSAYTRTLVMVSYLKTREWDKAIAAGEILIEDTPENWDAYTLVGGAYIGKGDTEQARVMFNKALELKPGNPNAASNLATLEMKAGNVEQARRLHEQVLEHHPGHVASLLVLSSLDYQQGEIDAAVERLEKAVDDDPGELSLRLTLANLYLRAGQASQALTLASQTAEEFDPVARNLEILGDAQAALGRREAAVKTFQTLVAMTPESTSSHYRLARAYAAANQLDRSSEQLNKVVELQPDHYAASVMRVRFLRQQNKLAEAAELLKDVDPAHRARPEYLIERGWLEMYQGRHAEAVQAFEQAYELVPSNVLLIQLSIAKWNMGDQAGAIAGYREWLKDNPNDTQVLFNLANSYLQLGQYKEAESAFSDFLEQKPDDPLALNNLAWLMRDSDPKKALEYAERTVSLAPEWAPGLDTKGSILLKQGDARQAYRLFGQALKYAPDNPDIRYHLAQASSELGEKEEAVNILEAILANPEARFGSRAEAEKLLKSLRG